jgi:hypothetical protein
MHEGHGAGRQQQDPELGRPTMRHRRTKRTLGDATAQTDFAG